MAGNDVPAPATFLLTRNAALDLRRIYTRSEPPEVPNRGAALRLKASLY